MSLNNSSSVVTDGLVFYYDQANTKKSWKGAPVTNAHWNGGSPFAPWTAGGVNTDITSTADGVPVPESKTWRFEKTGTTSQWNGWEGTYGGIWTGSAGDIWTTGYWYKTTQPSGLNGFQVGSFYTPDWVRAYASTILENQSSIIPDGKWRYNWTVTRIDEAYTNAIVVDGPAWGYSTTPGVLYINGLQWNKNSYAAPWAGGTRSNTQALLDMTGNNVITANGLTYNSSNSFSFNGSNNYVSFPYTQTNPNRFTVEAWFYNTAHSSDSNIGRILVIPYNGYNGWILSLNGPNSFLQLRHHNFNLSSTSYNVAHNTGLDLNKWYQVAAVDNGVTVTLYINGKMVVSAASATSTTNSPMTCRIGAWSDTVANTSFNGSRPVVKINNKPLSAQEISRNFDALRGRYGL